MICPGSGISSSFTTLEVSPRLAAAIRMTRLATPAFVTRPLSTTLFPLLVTFKSWSGKSRRRSVCRFAASGETFTLKAERVPLASQISRLVVPDALPFTTSSVGATGSTSAMAGSAIATRVMVAGVSITVCPPVARASTSACWAESGATPPASTSASAIKDAWRRPKILFLLIRSPLRRFRFLLRVRARSRCRCSCGGSWVRSAGAPRAARRPE